MELEVVPSLPQLFRDIAVRAANEGIPVGAIARSLKFPFASVSAALNGAILRGDIIELPKPDWPPDGKWAARLPTIPRSRTPEDTSFLAKKVFKLTKLEAAFMLVLLRHECVDKPKLHAVIEEQRADRAARLNNFEATDPKMVDVIICKLRKKLTATDPAIKLTTSWGSGYYFDAAVKQLIYGKLGETNGPAAECGGVRGPAQGGAGAPN